MFSELRLDLHADGSGGAELLSKRERRPLTGLSETTAPSGGGGFTELPPGTDEIELGGTAANCALRTAWAGTGADRVKVPVEAGFFTDAYVVCDAVAP